jgi:hypothetical protein
MAKCYLSTHCGSQRPSLSLYSNSLLFAKMYVSKLLFHPGKTSSYILNNQETHCSLDLDESLPTSVTSTNEICHVISILFDCSPNIKPVICHVRTFSS